MKKLIYILLPFTLVLTSCTSQPEAHTQTIFAMDTAMSITVYGDNAEQSASSAAAEINRLSALWSATSPDSEISRLNNGETVALSNETAELLRFAIGMRAETGGALDIRLYPLQRAWGFPTKEYRVPDESEITLLLSSICEVELSGETLTLPEGTEIDLGAVAKGYTGDIIASQLREAGVTSGLLDLGGNIHAIGYKPDGSKWRLGIKNPHGDGNIGVLELADLAAVTSGDYERYFEQDGVRYCHILNPETGRPADSGLSSVTVVGKSGVTCDVLSTALYVMGADRATEYWHTGSGFGMILVEKDGDILLTQDLADSFIADSGFSQRVEIIR